MKITALVENKSGGTTHGANHTVISGLKPTGLRAVHGLSLYIETPNHKILFDLGPDKTLFDNSAARGIDLTAVDTVIISHGHYDHGGPLEQFLEINHTAKVYVQRKAFQKHLARVLLLTVNVGIDATFLNHPQIVLTDGDFKIDSELQLFTVSETSKCYSEANDTLYTDGGKDTFSHEQNLIISGDTNVLFTGCGHTGIVNIMEKAAEYRPSVCIGGYHLFNPTTKKTVSSDLLDAIAEALSGYDTRYYTCHCTGEKAYRHLAARVSGMSYLACGDTIDV